MRLIRTKTAVALGGAILVLGATTALAGSSVDITAKGGLGPVCINKKTGVIRSVQKDQTCRAGERRTLLPVTINIDRSALKGDTGPTGPQGPQGPQGSPGLSGVPGSFNDLVGLACKLPDGASGTVVGTMGTYPGGGGTASAIDSGGRYLGTTCVTKDGFEPNDDLAHATDATSFTSGGNNWWYVDATIFPAGDEDWYVLPNANLQTSSWSAQIVLSSSSNLPSKVLLDVYRDGTLVASGVQHYAVDNAPHDWAIRVYSSGPASYFLYFNGDASWTPCCS